MCDKLVFDLAQEVEGSPSVFVRKDWINILDNMTQNYSGNQSIIDTSQLSNSNKYMSYREAYFLIPLTLTLASVKGVAGEGAIYPFNPIVKPCDNAIGLKNWFGQIIHSFTLDYNGTTIIQQTPFINMWNSFKLMTSLSYGDIITQGATIGFYPDDPTAWTFTPSNVAVDGTDPRVGFGQGVANSLNCSFIGNGKAMVSPAGSFCNTNTATGNIGMSMRQSWVNYDATGGATSSTYVADGAYSSKYITRYGDLLPHAASQQLWKSMVYNKVAQAAATAGVLQIQVVATVYLKHVHSFFNMIPLLKGVFMKMTLLLNNCTTQFFAGCTAGEDQKPFVAASQVLSSVAGCNPGLIAGTSGVIPSPALLNAAIQTDDVTSGSYQLCTIANGTALLEAGAYQQYYYNISVGATCLDQNMQQLGGLVSAPGPKSVYLYIPSYVFNPTFEAAYLSSPVKQVKYTDVYQYPVTDQASEQQINRLLTNGIADVKSVLVLPFYSRGGTGENVTYADTALNGSPAATVSISPNTGFITGTPVYQSPFDPAGSGATSPLCLMTNFNIQVSGQNAIYNTELYGFEHFNNQLYGQNAVNGGLTDGITSGLIDRMGFDMEYCYYYVNVERMLPVEKSVPKSIQFLGTNKSKKAIDFICFVEYGVEISIDSLTGARV